MIRSIDNYILRALPDTEYEMIASRLQKKRLEVGDVVNRPYEPIPFVYFPEKAMVSVIAVTADGQSSEVGVVGQEGFLGISVVFGAETTPHENIVQLPGTAWSMPTDSIREMFDLCPQLRFVLLRFAHAHLVQISQTALCNRLHDSKMRLARWILMCHDRSAADFLPLRQDLLAVMLGVHRPTVSSVAIQFKDEGFIDYSRGRIKVLDRQSLENISCDCYRLVKEEYESVLNIPKT